MQMTLRNSFIVTLLLCLSAVAVLTGSCTNNDSAGTTIRELTPQEAFDLIQENKDNPDFLIIDVRTPEEFNDGHIEGAINIDYYQPAFSEEISSLERDKTYFIYCRTGNRSSSVRDLMEELEFKEIHHLSDGIVGWNQAGLPVIT